MLKKISGLTTIEVAIAATLVVLLCIAGIPKFQDIQKKSAFSKAESQIEKRQAQVADFASAELRLPTLKEISFLDPIAFDDSKVVIYSSNPLPQSYQINALITDGDHSETILMTAIMDADGYPGDISWSCQVQATKNEKIIKPLYAPDHCRAKHRISAI